MNRRSIFEVYSIFCVLLGIYLVSARSHPDLSDEESEAPPSWDKTWCHYQRNLGLCKQFIPLNISSFYYDVVTDECKPFIFGGCDGNMNRFNTEERCLERCKGAYEIIARPHVLKYCIMQPDPGLCAAEHTRYFYNITADTCQRFIYGGCGGNVNKFLDKQSCLNKCKGAKLVDFPEFDYDYIP